MFKPDSSGSAMYLEPLRQVKSLSFSIYKIQSEKNKPKKSNQNKTKQNFSNVENSHNCVTHIVYAQYNNSCPLKD